MTRLAILFLLSLLAAWSLAACTRKTRESNFLDREGLLHARTLQKPRRQLFVINDPGRGETFWGRQDEGEPARPLHTPPEQEMSEVVEISISPDDRYLAMITVGEGHPILQVFELAKILTEEEDGGETRPVPHLLSINPYPGTIGLAGWRKGSLKLLSDIPLDQTERGETLEPSEKMRTWDLDLTTGKISDSSGTIDRIPGIPLHTRARRSGGPGPTGTSRGRE